MTDCCYHRRAPIHLLLMALFVLSQRALPERRRGHGAQTYHRLCGLQRAGDAALIAEEKGILAKYNVDSDKCSFAARRLVAGLPRRHSHRQHRRHRHVGGRCGGPTTKMVAAFPVGSTYDLVTRPSMQKKAEELRGKRLRRRPALAARCGWASCFAVEHFGLDEQARQDPLQVIGDQSIQMRALENGTIDAAVLDGASSAAVETKASTSQENMAN